MNKDSAAVYFLLGRLFVGAFFVFAGLDSLVNLEQNLRTAASGPQNVTLFMLVSGILLVCGALAFITAAYVILCDLWALRK